MIHLNVGAPRRATGDARATRIAAANDLVKRTLAQHGLMPGGLMPDGGGTADVTQPAMPSLQDMLARFAPQDAPVIPLPDGATCDMRAFSGPTGSRSYQTYVPATATAGVTGIVVMLHGCTQTAQDFALGTGMNALAEKHRLVVIYPQQSRGDNAQSCWNWFSRGDQRRDRGEPAILAGIARHVMAEHDVPRDRTFVAGLSAGAAMAVILGETYPDIFAAVGTHSGLPFGAANDVPSAFAAMAGNGAEPAAAQSGASPVRTIVFHGSADATVHPVNADRILRQVIDRGGRETIETRDHGTASGRSYTRNATSAPGGRILSEHWAVDGLGHAWSGGQPQGSYTDPKGPDASAEMIRFFLDTPDRGR